MEERYATEEELYHAVHELSRDEYERLVKLTICATCEPDFLDEKLVEKGFAKYLPEDREENLSTVPTDTGYKAVGMIEG